ncbi:MAG: ABC transporter permease [Acidobacteriota bacterium]
MRVRTSLLGEIIRIALASILAHKLRTFLTLLGIIVGVASVVVVGAGLTGAQTYILDSVSQALGSNSFIVTKFVHFGNVSDEDWQKMIRRNKDIKLEDVEFLRKRCPDCGEITAEVGGVHTTYAGSQEMLATTVRGLTANAVYLGNFEVEEGRFFSRQESRGSRYVCIIGSELREKFFPTVDALGRTVKVAGQPLRVLGVLEQLGSNFGQSQDRVLYMPITTYQKLFGSRRSIMIRGKASSRDLFDTALDQVRVAMRVRHQLKPGEDEDFGLISTEEINDTVDQFTATVATVVIPITLISMVVAGIVIMNIMLVSVTERTFEIGIRKALGARRRDILNQFLIESFVMAALGGAVGLGLAYLLAWAVEAGSSFPMEISWVYMVLSVGVSGGIGIIFGIYPAFKASKLDPIIAITAER